MEPLKYANARSSTVIHGGMYVLYTLKEASFRMSVETKSQKSSDILIS